MAYEVIDVADPQSVERVACGLKNTYPSLNCLFNNAGVQRKIDFNQSTSDLSSLAKEIDINLKGVVFVTSAILPIIKGKPNATIVNTSSALAFVPLVEAPVYSATKS